MKYNYTMRAIVVLTISQIYANACLFASPGIQGLKVEFERIYNAWKHDCDAVAFSSLIDDRFTTNYLAIVEMGMKALPMITEKCVTDAEFHWSDWAWCSIARYSPVPPDNPWAEESTSVWWAGGQALGNERSESIVAKIKTAREVGDKAAEARHWRTLRCLGIFSLETMFKELRNGDIAALEPIKSMLHREIKQGKLDKDADSAGLLAWWEKNKSDFKLPPGEITPAMRLPPPPFW